jgi:hypothetical protein
MQSNRGRGRAPHCAAAAIAVASVLAAGAGPTQAQYDQYFQDFSFVTSTNTTDFQTTLTNQGWVFVNNSTPDPNPNPVSATWGPGQSSTPTDLFGQPLKYMDITFGAGPSFTTTATRGFIDAWALSPVVSFQNGSRISFWTRTVLEGGTIQHPDRLQVRFSSAGSSTNVGSPAGFDDGTNAAATAAEQNFGNFSKLLVDINPTYSTATQATYPTNYTASYPTNWTRYDITLSGLAAGTINGRVGFRYFVENANGSASDSFGNYIAIDSVALDTPEPGTLPLLAGGVMFGVAMRLRCRRRSDTSR